MFFEILIFCSIIAVSGLITCEIITNLTFKTCERSVIIINRAAMLSLNSCELMLYSKYKSLLGKFEFINKTYLPTKSRCNDALYEYSIILKNDLKFIYENSKGEMQQKNLEDAYVDSIFCFYKNGKLSFNHTSFNLISVLLNFASGGFTHARFGAPGSKLTEKFVCIIFTNLLF
jgi:hypothetical protein